MEVEKKEEEKREVRPYKGGVFDSMRENPWMPATIVLVIVLAGLLIFGGIGGGSGVSGNVVSEKVAGDNLVSFVNSQGQGNASIVSSEKDGTLYKVTVAFNGQDIPVYVTLDGNYLVTTPIPLTDSAKAASAAANGAGNANGADSQQAAPKDVPKTEKPSVELYVFAYCPYGLQMEKALFPVYNMLKAVADIKIVYIGAMHDPQGCTGTACFEETESYRQICVQKNYVDAKYWAYLSQFAVNTDIGSCSGSDTCLTPLLQKIYTNLSIDKAKIDACMASDAPAIYDADVAKASAAGVSGSPTFIINGVQASVSRSPDAVKTAICGAFTTEPSACSNSLSTAQASAGFGTSSGTGSSAASCG